MHPYDGDMQIKYAEAEFLANDRRWAANSAAAVSAWEKLQKVGPAHFVHVYELAKRDCIANPPTCFDLSDADTTSPEFKLSSLSRVAIVARASRTGDARAQAGDFEGVSPAIAIGADGVSVLINKVL